MNLKSPLSFSKASALLTTSSALTQTPSQPRLLVLHMLHLDDWDFSTARCQTELSFSFLPSYLPLPSLPPSHVNRGRSHCCFLLSCLSWMSGCHTRSREAPPLVLHRAAALLQSLVVTEGNDQYARGTVKHYCCTGRLFFRFHVCDHWDART